MSDEQLTEEPTPNEYGDQPQRWLQEHGAVASEEGWRRPETNELLKCQKGLIIEPQ